jgi:serine/threonine protein kinase
VHRDVKLSNVLVDPTFSTAVLGDWGCGAWVSDSLKTKAGSRSCRPPEMLFGYRGYGTGCDIWAFGMLILGFLSGGWIPWKKSTAVATLAGMSEYFGGKNLIAVAEKLGLKVPDFSGERIWSDGVRKSFEVLYYEPVSALRDPALVEIMFKCLSLDPAKRPTAEEVLAHRFFAGE